MIASGWGYDIWSLLLGFGAGLACGFLNTAASAGSAVSLPILMMIGLVALSVPFYLRRRIGTARWRAAHRFIPWFWALAVLHTVLAGTDVGQPWFLIATVPPVVVALVWLMDRWDQRSRATGAGRGPSGPPEARSGSARGPVAPTRTAPDASGAGR